MPTIRAAILPVSWFALHHAPGLDRSHSDSSRTVGLAINDLTRVFSPNLIDRIRTTRMLRVIVGI
jgi:hypothetical protein